jgi:hypothetical protein
MMSRRLYIHQVGYPWAMVDRMYGVYCETPQKFPPLPRRDMLDLIGCYLRPPR